MKKDLMLLTNKNVEYLNLGEYSSEEITNLDSLFEDCDRLERIDLLGFDTSGVQTMNNMFSGCTSLNDIELFWFSTSSCVAMERMFANCHSLTTLDLSNFETSKVKCLRSMFSGCSSLETLDISGFELSKDADIDNMFEGCIRLREIIMKGCDNLTIQKIRWAYFESNKKPITIIVDNGVYLDVSLTLHCPTCDILSDKPIESFGHWINYTPNLFAYGTSCFYNAFDEDLIEGNEVIVVVRYSVFCKVGEYFSVATVKGLRGRGYECGYITFELLEIIAQNVSSAIVRVQINKIGSYLDFIKNAPTKSCYSYAYPPLSGNPADHGVFYQDEKSGILILSGILGGGDMAEHHHIITHNEIDCLVAIEFRTFDVDFVGFLGEPLGPHCLSPYKQ